jgi:hypothetical protein
MNFTAFLGALWGDTSPARRATRARTSWLVLSGLAPFAGACESTGVGNPYRETSFEIVATESPEPDAEDPNSGLAVDALEHAILVVAQFEFEPCDSNFDTVAVDGPFVVDLMAAKVEPKLPPVATPPGGFCALAAPLAPAKRPASLAGRSIFLSGRRADGAPFLVYVSADITLRAEARDGQAWGYDDPHPLLWAFRPQRWLEQSEADEAELEDAEGQRAVVIDADRHPLLYLAILARIGGRSDIYRDLNDNSKLDSTELDNGWVGRGLGTTE